MPRGDNPNSKANLLKGKRINEENAREYGKKSAQAKKEYKSFQECFKDMITEEQRKKLFETMYRKAQAGNIKAFEVLRDTMGEKPVEKVMLAEVEQSVIDEVQDAIERARNNDN